MLVDTINSVLLLPTLWLDPPHTPSLCSVRPASAHLSPTGRCRESLAGSINSEVPRLGPLRWRPLDCQSASAELMRPSESYQIDQSIFTNFNSNNIPIEVKTGPKAIRPSAESDAIPTCCPSCPGLSNSSSRDLMSPTTRSARTAPVARLHSVA